MNNGPFQPKMKTYSITTPQIMHDPKGMQALFEKKIRMITKVENGLDKSRTDRFSFPVLQYFFDRFRL